MALTDKLNAIADAIREKTGREDKMTLVQMPAEITGIRTGVTLPELEKPASATDLAEGKELIDQNGNVVTGTSMEPALVGLSQTPDFLSQNSSGQVLIQSGLYNDDVPDFIVRKGTKFRTRAPLSEFGNATANQVAKGATFTSSAGLLVEGTASGGFTVTDDGEGNVTITSSAITDNNGDVVIG